MIDTLKFAKELQEVGMTPEQSEVYVRNLLNLMKTSFATRSEMNKRFDQVDRRFDSFDNEMSKRFGSFDNEMNKRFDSFDNEMNKRFDSLDNEMNKRFNQMDRQFDKVESRFESLEQKMVIKLGAMQVATLGIFIALQKLL